MAIETKTKEINGTTYEITTLGARAGSKVSFSLVRFAAPAITQAMAVAEQGDEAAIMAGVKAFAESATDQDFALVADVFAGSTKVHTVVPMTNKGPQTIKQDLDWDSHFAGNYTGLIQWLVWCIRENFADFFDGKAGMSAKGILTDLAKGSGSESPKG